MIEGNRYSTIKLTQRSEVVGQSEIFVVGLKVIDGKIVTQKLPDVSPFCNPLEFWTAKAKKDGAIVIVDDQRKESSKRNLLVILN